MFRPNLALPRRSAALRLPLTPVAFFGFFPFIPGACLMPAMIYAPSVVGSMRPGLRSFVQDHVQLRNLALGARAASAAMPSVQGDRDFGPKASVPRFGKPGSPLGDDSVRKRRSQHLGTKTEER